MSTHSSLLPLFRPMGASYAMGFRRAGQVNDLTDEYQMLSGY
ncbi:MAG: hypothetical protein RIC85_02275 [Gammaproteobacteria bacterium]